MLQCLPSFTQKRLGRLEPALSRLGELTRPRHIYPSAHATVHRLTGKRPWGSAKPAPLSYVLTPSDLGDTSTLTGACRRDMPAPAPGAFWKSAQRWLAGIILGCACSQRL